MNGHFVGNRILATERLKRSEGAEIRSSEHDNAREPGRLFEEGRTGDEAAHAVGHEVDFGAFRLDLSGELLAEADQVKTPIIGKEVGIVAGNPQLELEVGEENHH
jgi:hypothetical protein